MNKIVIRPKKNFSFSDIKEIWESRELLYFLVWRDIKVKYKQTAIGVLWVVFQPFLMMVIFSFFFGKLMNISSDGVPYPIFIYTGLLFWQFFYNSITDVSNVLINNQSIITKVYFPRLVLPISSIIIKILDFAVAMIILIGMMIYYNYTSHLLGLLIIPLLLIITFMISLGLGLVFASINVKYRDIKYILPFFIQAMLFITPVIYPASIAGKYSWVLAMNPMMGVIQSARAALLGTTQLNWILILVTFFAASLLMIIGIYKFRKTERYVADII